jgi:hypothetical protein
MCIEKTAHHNNIGRLQIHGRAPRFFTKKDHTTTKSLYQQQNSYELIAMVL